MDDELHKNSKTLSVRLFLGTTQSVRYKLITIQTLFYNTKITYNTKNTSKSNLTSNTKAIFNVNTFSILKIHNLTTIIKTLTLCSMFLKLSIISVNIS